MSRRAAALLIAAIAAGAAAAARAPAEAASLEVTVHGVRDNRGQIRIGVCTRAEFLSDICALHAVVPAHAGDVEVRIPGIPPGIYAVAAFQDLDGSGRLKRGLLGRPEEDVGFSRDPGLRFGPPSFARAAITVGNKAGHVALMLHRFGS